MITIKKIIRIFLFSFFTGIGLLILSTIISLFLWPIIDPLSPACAGCVDDVVTLRFGFPFDFSGISYINLLLDFGFYVLISLICSFYNAIRRSKKK